MGYVTSWERMGEKKGFERGFLRGFEKGFERGFVRGFEKGEKKGILKTAREMVNYGVDKGIISKVTGLPREEIEQLAETADSIES